MPSDDGTFGPPKAAASRASHDEGGARGGVTTGFDFPSTSVSAAAALSTSLVQITAGTTSARLSSRAKTSALGSAPSIADTASVAPTFPAPSSASFRAMPLQKHPRPTTTAPSSTVSVNTNAQHPPRTSGPSAASSISGVVFPSVLLPSMMPLPGSTVRPSTAIEAQVHASIKGTSFAVPPLASSSFSAATPSTTSDVPTPEVFRNRRLRSGKWIKEEELYADLLIEQFEGGIAPDCPNGVTLRAYLSKKLHCAPMRISKKYAGKGIGKMVFVSKAGSDGATGSSSSSSCPPEERRRRKALVKEREDRFYKAAFRSNDFLGIPYGFVFGPPPTNPIVIPAHPPQIQIPFGVAPIHVPFDAAASIGSVAVLPQAHVPMLPVATTGPAPAPAFGSNPVNQPSAPAGGAPAVFPAPTTLGPTHAAPPQGTVLKPRPSPPPVVGPVPSQGAPVELNEQTLKLHQSYMNALQQHPSLFRDPQQPTSSLQTSTSATRSEPAAQAAASGPGVGKPLPWRPSQPLHSGNATIAESRNGSTSESQSNAPVRLVAPMQHQRSVPVPIAGPALGPPALPPPSPIDPLKDLASSAPDFLSGFDRVALSLKPSPCDTEKLASLPQPQGDLHCSPTFTSRSFDDFHRFLGQDLVHLGSPARPPTGQDIDFLRPRAGSESAPPMFPIHAATEAPSAFVAKRPSAPVLSLAANGGSNIDVPSGGDVEQVLLRSNSQEVNSMFSADSYCLFASAAVAASSQHAAYSAPPGALFGMAHAGKGLEGKGNKAHGHGMLIKRNRADTFDMESTMNIVSAHVGGLQRQEQRTSFDLTNAAERTRTFQCSTVTLPTPRATMWERMYELRRENDTAQLVSGSEPSTSSATTETESGNGSSSGKASPNCSEPSDHSEDSSSCCSDIMSDDESDSHLLHHHHTHKTKKARIGAGDVDETFAAPGAGNQAYTL